MKDVAKRCGVAESTVSRVISGRKFVAAGTREAVEQAMRELNFHRDAHASRLARGRSDFLGLVISDVSNPFYAEMIKAFESAALAQGFEVLLATTHYDARRTEGIFRRLIQNKSPGVAVMTSRVDAAFGQQLARCGVHSVFLDSAAAGPWRSNIRLDYQRGAGEAVRYLHRLGHRRFALVAGPQARASHVAYREAVQSELKSLRCPVTVLEGDNTPEGGATAAAAMMTRAQMPTAVLCSNDLTAFGLTGALVRAGLRVPQDVSVVGADDIPFARLFHPPLTTVRMPQASLGAMAFEVLSEMITQRVKTGKNLELATELVVRESAAPRAAD